MTTDKFFTAESLTTVGGSALLVWVVVNALRRFFGLTMPWLFLLVSALVNGGVFVAANGRAPTFAEGVVLVGNIVVVALAALGMQEAAVSGPGVTKGGEQHAREKVAWFSPWLR